MLGRNTCAHTGEDAYALNEVELLSEAFFSEIATRFRSR